MRESPPTLDGARVLAIADLSESTPTGGTLHIVDGEVLVTPAVLAIAQYEGDEGFYLFYCDERWSVITDTLHDSMTQAVEQARFEFSHVVFVPRASSA